MNVAGLDPGRMTALVVVDDLGVIKHVEQAELEGDMIARSLVIRAVLQRAWSAGAKGIVIEDLTNSATIGGRKGAARRHPKSIASVQRDFAATVALAVETWHRDRIVLALVAQWYPRISGQMVKKEICLKLQKQRAEMADADGARQLTNEHLKVAYGLALYGQGSRRFWLGDRRPIS